MWLTTSTRARERASERHKATLGHLYLGLDLGLVYGYGDDEGCLGQDEDGLMKRNVYFFLVPFLDCSHRLADLLYIPGGHRGNGRAQALADVCGLVSFIPEG